MIRIFSFEPKYFNNNGDQGNLEVISFLLRSSGVDYQLSDSVKGADFVLVGDASRAVINHFKDELHELRPSIVDRYSLGQATLIVGSAYEFFARDLGLSTKGIQRRSGFVTTAEGFFGYQNTDVDLPAVFTNDAFLATNLFGPVLAKNPDLLGVIASALGIQAQLPENVIEWVSAIRKKAE